MSKPLDRIETALVEALKNGLLATREADQMSPMDRALATMFAVALKSCPLPDRGKMLANLMTVALGMQVTPAELHLAIDAAASTMREAEAFARHMQPVGKVNGS